MGLVTRYIIDIQETLRVILRQPVDKEMLHKFRVQLKKMKAIWAIHPIGNNIAFKRSFPTLNNLFKHAAIIRDAQMILECLESLPAFPEFPFLKKLLKSEIKKKQKKFTEKIRVRKTRFGVYEENRIFLAYFKLASATLVRQNRKDFRFLTYHLLTEASGKNPQALHKLRSHCKYMMYQAEAFQHNHTSPSKIIPKETLNSLQHNLGTWHDWWNTAEWLNQQEANGEKNKTLKTLGNQAAKKEEFLRREVLLQIQTALHGIETTAKA